MCCFSQPVELVAGTNIFARASKEGRQFLVYSMTVKAKADLAMILPLPVPKASAEDAVKFINLEKYADFFEELQRGFPVPRAAGIVSDLLKPLSKDDALKVIAVGSFEASFVPTLKDFSRLDERFRLPSGTWEKLPAYKDYGFAVFQLKKGEKKIHPMAFEFPRANPKKLFFPTVHIHDGKVHAKADFDHWLFCQESGDAGLRWEESPQPAHMFMQNVKNAQGIISPDDHVFRKQLHGNYKNEDILI